MPVEKREQVRCFPTRLVSICKYQASLNRRRPGQDGKRGCGQPPGGWGLGARSGEPYPWPWSRAPQGEISTPFPERTRHGRPGGLTNTVLSQGCVRPNGSSCESAWGTGSTQCRDVEGRGASNCKGPAPGSTSGHVLSLTSNKWQPDTWKFKIPWPLWKSSVGGLKSWFKAGKSNQGILLEYNTLMRRTKLAAMRQKVKSLEGRLSGSNILLTGISEGEKGEQREKSGEKNERNKRKRSLSWSKRTLQVVKSTKCPAVGMEGHQCRQVLARLLNKDKSFLEINQVT